MAKIKLVTNVSEYALLRSFARTRARLVVSTAVMTAATVGFGLWSAYFVLDVSSSVGANLGLITINMMLMLVAAYLQTVLLGDLTFPGPWREQVIMRKAPSGGVSVQSHDAEFMILLLILVVANGLVVNLSSGGFLDTYHNEGFFRSRLRSDVPEERLAALEYMVDPLNFELWPLAGVQSLVLQHLDDPDEAPRLAAIWNSGEMKISNARPRLLKMVVEGPEVIRAEAAQALGKLGNEEEARTTLERRLSEESSSKVLVGLLRGLALIKSPLSIDAALPLINHSDDAVMLHAFWVLRNSGEPKLRSLLHEELGKGPKGQRFCALLDTLKMVATAEDVTWARRRFQEVDKEAKCDRVVWEERNERQHYVLYSDSFRVKYLKIVANASGGENRAWFERIVADPEQTWRVREVASEIVKRLDEAKPRR